MTTDQATTVRTANNDDLIRNECKVIAFYLRYGQLSEVEKAQKRLERFVLRKHGKLS